MIYIYIMLMFVMMGCNHNQKNISSQKKHPNKTIPAPKSLRAKIPIDSYADFSKYLDSIGVDYEECNNYTYDVDGYISSYFAYREAILRIRRRRLYQSSEYLSA